MGASQYERVGGHRQWYPGLFYNIPWQGFGALLGAIVGLVAAVTILIGSDKQPISHWRVQPSVWLTVSYTLTNIFLAVALREGVTIAWWNEALRETGTVGDLHFTWARGSSVWQALKAAGKLKLIAYACLAVALAPVNGPLFQRATTTGFDNASSSVTLQLVTGTVMPNTGSYGGRGSFEGLTTNFTAIYQDFSTTASILASTTGCDDTCHAVITGPGLVANCTTYDTTFDLLPDTPSSGAYNASEGAFLGYNIFSTTVELEDDGTDVIMLNAQYKNTTACKGVLTNTNCTLRLGTVKFPVVVNGKQSTIQLDPSTSIFDDTALGVKTDGGGTNYGGSQFSGLEFVLSTTFTSTVYMRFGGAVNYETTLGNGVTAARHVTVDPTINSDDPPYTNCSLSFSSPMPEMLAAARALVFRTTIAAQVSPVIQSVAAQQTGLVQVYLTSMGPLVAACFFTVLAWLLVVPTFSGYWRLGRSVSMSPIEVAKAFAAPLLKQADPNSTAKELVDEVGRVDVQYGAVTAHGDEQKMVLKMAKPGTVSAPEAGQVFRG